MPGIYGYAQQAITRIHRIRDRWLRAHGSDQCHAGCSFCCQQAVGCLIVEGVWIAWPHTTPLSELPTIQERVAFAERVAAELGRTTRLKPCFALDERGNCTIYPRRPISCAVHFPAERCSATARVQDAREPVHAARDLDLRFCKRVRLPYPGPLLLPKAIQVGAALLRHGPEAAAALIGPTDIIMDVQLLRGGRA